MNDDNGVKNLLEKLDRLYLKDDAHSAYESYERFETFSIAPSMTVSDCIIEFERLYNKAKQHKMELPGGALACRFLDSAYISSHHKLLVVRATLPELSYLQFWTNIFGCDVQVIFSTSGHDCIPTGRV